MAPGWPGVSCKRPECCVQAFSHPYKRIFGRLYRRLFIHANSNSPEILQERASLDGVRIRLWTLRRQRPERQPGATATCLNQRTSPRRSAEAAAHYICKLFVIEISSPSSCITDCAVYTARIYQLFLMGFSDETEGAIRLTRLRRPKTVARIR